MSRILAPHLRPQLPMIVRPDVEFISSADRYLRKPYIHIFLKNIGCLVSYKSPQVGASSYLGATPAVNVARDTTSAHLLIVGERRVGRVTADYIAEETCHWVSTFLCPGVIPTDGRGSCNGFSPCYYCSTKTVERSLQAISRAARWREFSAEYVTAEPY